MVRDHGDSIGGDYMSVEDEIRVVTRNAANIKQYFAAKTATTTALAGKQPNITGRTGTPAVLLTAPTTDGGQPGTLAQSTFLGASAKAADSELLDGQDSTYYATAAAVDGKQPNINGNSSSPAVLLTAPATTGGQPGNIAQTTFAPRAGGFTFSGNVGAYNASILESQFIRNIVISTTDLTPGTSSLTTGVIHVVYE
jgi:hypothetical protein